MISERTLRMWRRTALKRINELRKIGEDDKESMLIIDQRRILALTMELLDQHLLKK